MYGGYFGAAQGVLLMAVLGIGIADSLQRLNAIKNVLALVVNGVAAVIFIVGRRRRLGGRRPDRRRLGRRRPARRDASAAGCPPLALRGVIVVVGLVALAVFLVR